MSMCLGVDIDIEWQFKNIENHFIFHGHVWSH